MENLKNNKEFTIICISCIFLVLALCYFGINNFVNDTYAAETTEMQCASGLQVTEYLGKYHCCPSSDDSVVKASDGKYYCLGINEIEDAQGGIISDGHAFTEITIVDSKPYCAVTVDSLLSGITLPYSAVCPDRLGSAWSTIEETCTTNPLSGKVCKCKASLSTCDAQVAEAVSCSNGGTLTDTGCVKNGYTIKYDVKGGNSLSKTSDSCTPSGNSNNCSVTLPTPTKSGDTFNGWFVDMNKCYRGETGHKGVYYLDSTNNGKTLYACWQSMVTEETCWQCNSDSNNYCWAAFNSDCSNSCPAGWHELNLSKDECKKPDSTTKYYISYNSNGGTGTMSKTDCTNGCTLPNNGFSKTNCGFDGWNTEADGSGVGYSSGDKIKPLSSDATLYAQWKCSSGNNNNNNNNQNNNNNNNNNQNNNNNNNNNNQNNNNNNNNNNNTNTGTNTGNNNGNNVQNNPPTGEIAIFIVWVIGFVAIVYSVVYFKKIKN